MDVEKTIEFILEQQAHTAASLARLAESQETTAARIEQNQAAIAELDRRVRRSVRLAIEEARAERRKRREMDARYKEQIAQSDARFQEQMTNLNILMNQLAAAQLVTEEKLQRYLESRRGTNGSK